MNLERREKSHVLNINLEPKEKIALHVALIRNKFKSRTPLSLLTLEIFNHNVHNFLVNSEASSDVMPFSFVQKLA